MFNVFKYEATGNDFILTTFEPNNPSEFALKVCDRHFGIGADGILFPSESTIADFKMNYYNADGTIAPMCGNGIRSFARFLFDQKLTSKEVLKIETLAGMMILYKKGDQFEVNLGLPVENLKSPDITDEQFSIEKRILTVKNKDVLTYTFILGTLHTIVYVNDLNQFDDIADDLCHHPFFPKRSNINFVKVIDKNTMEVKTYERGVGWTLSCGTGSSASQYLSNKLNYTNEEAKVIVPGGQLVVTNNSDGVYLLGPANLIAKIEME